MHCRAKRWRNYRLYQKIVQIKVVENEKLYKEVGRSTYLPSQGTQLGASKD